MGQFLRTYKRIAQKEHWCDRCFTNIQPGDWYEGIVYLLRRGKIMVLKNHINPACEYPPEPKEEREREEHKPIAAIAA